MSISIRKTKLSKYKVSRYTYDIVKKVPASELIGEITLKMKYPLILLKKMNKEERDEFMQKWSDIILKETGVTIKDIDSVIDMDKAFNEKHQDHNEKFNNECDRKYSVGLFVFIIVVFCLSIFRLRRE